MSKKAVVVYTYVVGDLLHIGHLRALRQARALGDYLIVGVLTDEAAEMYKRKPIIPFEERKELIESLECVSLVVKQCELNPMDTIKRLISPPNIIVHGDDWGEDFPGAEYVRSIGGRAIRIFYYQEQSTTAIIKKIMGDIK